MSREEIKKGIITCFQNVGIMIPLDDISDDLEIQEYIEDSIMFITMIIELENHFGIEIQMSIYCLKCFQIWGR